MAKRFVSLLILLIVVAGVGAYAYDRYRTNLRYSDGEVTTVNGTEPVATNTRSETAASRSNWDGSGEDGPTQHGPVRTQLANEDKRLEADSERPKTFADRSDSPAMQTSDRNTAGFDSQTRNAPNGMPFTGLGKFEVYRQGDLTWRVNTETGSSCVLFATLEQWRKQVVYRNACAG